MKQFNDIIVTGRIMTSLVIKSYSIYQHFKSSLNTKLALILLLTCNWCITPLFAATYTVGTAGNYTTLKAAFDAVNAGSITGSITLQIISSTTETASASVNASGSGSASYTDITIYPTGSGYTISGSLNAALINLNGADNVIIDGRVNATGSTKDLTVSNTNTGASASAITFIESATTNTVKYCTLKGVSTSSTMGIVLFSTASAGNGNDGNTIDYCDIRDGASTPMIGVYSAGTVSSENSGNTISNNNIYNCYNSNYGYGVFVSSNSTGWTVSGNSIYQTSTRTGTDPLSGIYINSGNAHVISGNYIGGSSSQCGGSATTYNCNNANLFTEGYSVIGIYLNVEKSTATSVQNNTIKNITVNANPSSNRQATPLTGIFVNEGNVNIGTTTGNTVGSSSSTGSITLSFTGGDYCQAKSYGIRINGTGTVSVENNVISGIDFTGNGSDYQFSFYGIGSANVTSTAISYNTIGSTSTANSIRAQGGMAIIIGISAAMTIHENNIINLSNTASSSYIYSDVVGISVLSGVSTTVSNNTIRKLSSSLSTTGSGSTASLIGISQSSTTAGQTISGNTIDSISNTHATAAVNVYGIYYAGGTGGTNEVKGNFIRHLTAASSSTSVNIIGLLVNSGANTISNNIILLGKGLTTGYTILGISERGIASHNNNIYFNTVYLEGAPSNGTYTAAFYSAVSTNTRNFRNNIFHNARSRSAGTSKHYAAYFNYAVNTNLTLDYNNYYAPGTGGVLGYYNGTDQTLLPLVTGNDGSSAVTNPDFITAGGTLETDYYPGTPITGASGTGITTDYFGNTRGTPFAGALEGYVWKGTFNTDYGTGFNWVNSSVPPADAVIVFHSNPDRSCLLDQDRSVTSIINAQSTDQFVVNGFSLTIRDSLIFSNGAVIDASATNSFVVFAGTQVQTITASNFLDLQIQNLHVNNTEDIYLDGNIEVLSELKLENGIIYTDGNTLILHDNININGQGQTNYVDGKIQKIGDDQFTFPIGKNGEYAPISISDPSAANHHFTAEYFNGNPDPTYDRESVGTGVHHVSDREYWILDRTGGASNVTVTLSWDTRSGTIDNLTDLTVSRWDGSQWTDAGNASTTGNTSAGTITSNTVSSFSPFTLASKSSANPLPITLIAFSGECINDSIQLKWKTASERNNALFTVERSINANDWTSIGTKNGAINSNEVISYDFTDHEPLEKGYYRLKQTDQNGAFEYSTSIFVACDDRSKSPIIFPNPSRGIVNILNTFPHQKIELFNGLGECIYEDVINEQTELNLGYLPKGVYFILVSDEYRRFSQKLVLD